MEDELRPIGMYLITHYIWNTIRRDIKKRLLVIDEAWWMMKYEDTASFLYGIAKRCRKYYSGIGHHHSRCGRFLGVSLRHPDYHQLFHPAFAQTVAGNHRHRPKNFQSDRRRKVSAVGIGCGEGIFFAGLKHVAIKILASYTEDQIITSDPAQLMAIKKAKEEYNLAQQ